MSLARLCKVDRCEKPYLAKGFCSTHYKRVTSYPTIALDAPLRFQTRVARCVIENCGDPKIKSWGMCATHNRVCTRWKLSSIQYQMLLSTGCMICGGRKQLAIDHDHDCCAKQTTCGQCIRGMLCVNCNHALGHMKDDVSRLKKAIAYLERFPKYVK